MGIPCLLESMKTDISIMGEFMDNKVVFLMKAEKAVFKAAKSINQHIDRGDFRPDEGRVEAALKFHDDLKVLAKEDAQAKELLKRFDEVAESKENGWRSRIGKVTRLVFGEDEANQNDPRYLNVSAYKLTTRVCRKGFYLSPEGKTVELLSPEELIAATTYYTDPGKVDDFPVVGETQIEVVNEDCIKVAERLVVAGENPLLLNMASNRRPGGGVMTGSNAQEETIFRRSTAHLSLYQFHEELAQRFGIARSVHYYPMKRNTGGIYSGKVMFFREGQDEGYKFREEPFVCSMVTVAAEINKDREALRLPFWMVQVQKDKIRTILRIGLLNGHTTIILGAFGCGAYSNPPEHIAELFHQVFEEDEFKNKYKKIVFAIFDDANAYRAHNPDGNYLPFVREFGKVASK